MAKRFDNDFIVASYKHEKTAQKALNELKNEFDVYCTEYYLIPIPFNEN